jgi:DMSO reductase family type II enzyme heme b subunit
VDLEPPFDQVSVSLGKGLYSQLRCSRCHGKKGERAGPLEKNLKDIWGNASFVFDLRRPELYKTGASSDDMYRMLMTGIGGTQMNSYDYLSSEERWHLVHFLQSKFPSQAPSSPQTDDVLLSVPVSGPVGLAIEDSVWEQAPVLNVLLNSIKARERPIHSMTAQSVHDGQRIVFRLQWQDPVPDGAADVSSFYLDGAAIQFALPTAQVNARPFFGMGEQDKPVNLWHWKADANQKVYGSVMKKDRAPSAQKMFAHTSLNPFNESPVEELNAWGFGSLKVQPMENQQVSGKGSWKDGMWTVILIREFTTWSDQDIQFSGLRTVSLAFAVWDGSSRDRNANKMVSFWKTLALK